MTKKYDPFILSRYEGHLPVNELAYRAIRQAIFRRVLSPGERLVTEDLAARMKISRTPVREALRKLEIDGLVENKPWRGVVVAEQPSLEEMEEFYYIRGALEGLVAYFAARRQPREDLDALKLLIDAMYEAAEADDIERFMAIQVDFWDRYIGLAPSRHLFQMVSSIREYLERAKPVSLSRPGRMMEAMAELKEIYEAIVNEDPSRAEELARAHCRKAYEVFRTVMEWRMPAVAGGGEE